MVGQPDAIDVDDLEIDEVNLAHLANHDVAPDEVEHVRLHAPSFFRNLRGRAGSHIMIGRDQRGRVLYVVLVETAVPGRWRPITGWESRLARTIYGGNK